MDNISKPIYKARGADTYPNSEAWSEEKKGKI